AQSWCGAQSQLPTKEEGPRKCDLDKARLDGKWGPSLDRPGNFSFAVHAVERHVPGQGGYWKVYPDKFVWHDGALPDGMVVPVGEAAPSDPLVIHQGVMPLRSRPGDDPNQKPDRYRIERT